MKAQMALILLAGSVILNLALINRIQNLTQTLSARPEPIPAPAPVAAEAAPFRWSQLESSDYATYIANLRAIGCPEQTIREIIGADVDDIYASRREPLLKIIAAGGAAGEINQTHAALAKLRSEEAAVIRKLFGIPDPAEPAQQVAAAPRLRRQAVQQTNASMPLVFQPVDTNQVKLTPQDLQSLDRIRQEFMIDLGTNLDVNSPEYFKHWQAAQKQADELLIAFLGLQGKLDYEAAVQSQPARGN